MSVIDLQSTFLVLDPQLDVHPVAVTPTLYSELEANFNSFQSCLLIAEHEFQEDWNTWEQHPCGDEILYLLSGSAEMHFWQDEIHQVVVFDRPGTSLVVKRGVWHTAKNVASCRILFITPGEGTKNQKSVHSPDS